MKRELLWTTVLALVASAAAWLPKTIHRQCDVALRLSRSSVARPNDDHDSLETAAMVSGIPRRTWIRGTIVSAIGIGGGCGTTLSLPQAAAHAYTIDKVDPDENVIYAEAQNLSGPLKVLWLGPGVFAVKTGAARSGVYKDLFRSGNEVTALDLLTPKASDLRAAKKYAKEQGYTLRFQQGDATQLAFENESFDVVVCSLFLCQDFDPEVVVKEIRRVLKPDGRFGFFEHVEDIDKVVVGKVFGEESIVQLVAYPELQNILAGVVKKV